MIYEIENLVLVNELNKTCDLFDHDIARLPIGQYELIGIHSAEFPLSEEQCREAVEFEGYHMAMEIYKDYNPGEDLPYGFYKATDSFASLLKANDLWMESPYNDHEKTLRTGPFIVLKKK